MVGCSVVLKGQTGFFCVFILGVTPLATCVCFYNGMDALLLQNASTLSVKLSHTKKYSGWVCFTILASITTINGRHAKIEFLTIWSSLKVTHMYAFKGTQLSDIKHVYSVAIPYVSLAIGMVLH
jgi:hypothetical protein